MDRAIWMVRPAGAVIRVGCCIRETQYYVLKGVQYGISYEGGRAFEKYNYQYICVMKNLSLHVVFRPVQRDELFSHLTDGTADISPSLG